VKYLKVLRNLMKTEK